MTLPAVRELLDFLRLLRFGQASLSVAYHQRDLERAREGLAKAIRARDDALAAIRAAEPVPPAPPQYLLLANAPAKVRSIKRKADAAEAAVRG